MRLLYNDFACDYCIGDHHKRGLLLGGWKVGEGDSLSGNFVKIRDKGKGGGKNKN